MNEQPNLQVGEIIFAFDKNLFPQYYKVLRSENGQLFLTATNLSAELAFGQGDSGSPFYRIKANGNVEAVAVYLGQNLIPTQSGKNIEFIAAEFYQQKMIEK